MSEKRRVLKAAGTVGAWTMASRVLGYVRNAIIAAFFGAGLETDAFIAAFRIPNLLRRLFGEGSLTASFVPVYTDVRTNQGEERSRELFGAAFTAVLLIVSVLTVLGIVFAHKVVAVLAPGFGDDPAKEELTVFLLRLMFPYAVAICLVALFMGVQNARGFFFAPAFAPVLLNVSIIFSAVFLAGRFDLPVTALAVGVLVGGVLQFALQWPYLKKLGHRLRLRFDFKDRDLRRVGYLMLPSLIGLSVYSLNVFLNTIFASLLVPGAVSYLFYADQLMELPQGVFAIAVGTALLPSLSGLAARGDRQGLIETMNYAFRLVIIIILPTAVGLIVLAEPIVNVLFQRGEFNYLATARTASALRWYASGLLFFGSLRVMVPAFYALKNSLVPALAALAALVANIISGLSFMGPTVSDAMPLITAWTRAFNPTGPMQHDGLALANTVSAFVNMVVLGVVLRRRVGRIGGRKIAKTALQSGLACLLMAGAAWLIASRFQFTESGADPVRIAGLFAAILAGGGVYFGALALLDRKQARNVWRLVTRRKGALPEEPV